MRQHMRLANYGQPLIIKMEKRPWTEDQDRLLLQLIAASPLIKWTHIARALHETFGQRHNARQCRERAVLIDPSLPREEWTRAEEDHLYALHDQLGNRWAVIGHKLGNRSDNCVKNHFYARLRRALRRLQAIGPKPQRDMKPNILYRIVQAAEEKFRLQQGQEYDFALFANKLKNDLLAFSYDGEEDDEEDSPREHSPEVEAGSLEMARDLLGRVGEFLGSYRKKGKKERRASAQGSELFMGDRMEIRCNSEHPFPSSTSNFDASEEEQQPEATLNRFRKCSADCALEPPATRIRTRAHSQSNSHHSHEEPTHLPMDIEPDSLGIECILQGMKILQNFPTTHPLLMRKQTSKCWRLEEEGEEFRFFEDSEMEMRVLPEMEMEVGRDSREEDIF